jgi:hypothetical protein
MRELGRRLVFLLLIGLAGTLLLGEDPKPSLPSHVNISYQQAQPIIKVIGDHLPAGLKGRTPAEMPAIWPGWVRRHDQEMRARLMRGDEDSMVNFLVFGTSFTRQLRLSPIEFAHLRVGQSPAEAPSGTSPATANFFKRVDDLMRGLAKPGNNERLQFLAHFVERRGYHPREAYGVHSDIAERTRLKEYLLANVARVLKEQEGFQKEYQEARTDNGQHEDLAAVSTLYRSRGVSLDTSLLPNLALQEAMEAMELRGALAPGSVRRAAVIGPGLDFTDKEGGYDFYPQQTIQPFALVDTLFRLGLAHPGQLELTTFDISPRLNEHLSRARRHAQRGHGYVLQLPRNSLVHWNPTTSRYWQHFGDQIGAPVTPIKPPATDGSVETRAVRVRPDIVSIITPVDLDIVTGHLDLPPPKRFDLIIATNVFCYFDTFEQLLAVANTESMLRPGGFLLSNNVLPMLPSNHMRFSGLLPVTYSDRPNDGDLIVWYQRSQKR